MEDKNLKNILNRNFETIFNGYDLINYSNLTEVDSLQILELRNYPLIRSKMVDDQIISKDNHFNYVKSLSAKSVGYWALKSNDRIIGSISLVDYDSEKETFVAGNFLSPDLFNSGKGFLINYLTRIVAFEKIECQKILAHVKKDNISALRSNLLFDNGTAKDIIINSESYTNFEFFKEDWPLIKSKVEKYLKYVV